jgi:drug/metabolite transporter (DMT)-like permease
MNNLSPSFQTRKRLLAVGEAGLVTLIWGSSFVFVKIGLQDLGPLTIGGLRYFLGFLILLPWLVHRNGLRKAFQSKVWLRLLGIGISAYTVGNGALFWGLKYLPATMVSFLMSLTPLLMLFGGMIWLQEFPTRWQIVGVLISLLGSSLFFSSGIQKSSTPGLIIVGFGLSGFLAFGLLGRKIARDRLLDNLTLTALPLGIGGGLLLLIALPLEGFPVFSLQSAGIIAWLAVVNTAIAYLFYNHSLQVLTAMELNVVLNLTPLGTALLAWQLLDETLSLLQIAGMMVMIFGVVLVERSGKRRNSL